MQFTIDNPPEHGQHCMVADPFSEALFSRIRYDHGWHGPRLLSRGLLFQEIPEAVAKARLMLAFGNERVLRVLTSLPSKGVLADADEQEYEAYMEYESLGKTEKSMVRYLKLAIEAKSIIRDHQHLLSLERTQP